jgi:hypothetical protein
VPLGRVVFIRWFHVWRLTACLLGNIALCHAIYTRSWECFAHEKNSALHLIDSSLSFRKMTPHRSRWLNLASTEDGDAQHGLAL